ncbi:MAG: thymidylate synthase [Candidatus Nanopelagicus sp.]
MKQYLNLLQEILDTGEDRDDRTHVGTRSVFGCSIRFDLRRGFPAVTTKKLAWKACVGELLWFIEGSSDERRLAEITHGTSDGTATIWTPNAQANYWKPKAKFDGDLGRVYGVQWRDWRQYTWMEPVNSFAINKVDQLMQLITNLKKDPFSRRHMLSAWNVADLDEMALPPCHVMSQFYLNKDNELSCHMYQRSVDVFLGLPFNIASYALLTHMIAQVCNLKVGELIISTGDTHIYNNHIEQVKEQLLRTPYSLPTVWLDPTITDITKFTMDDIKLIEYESHGPIKAPMAV